MAVKGTYPSTPCPMSHVPHLSILNPTTTFPHPACWSNRRSRDSQAKHNDSRSPGHFDKPAGGGWSKAKAPGDSGSKLAPLGYRLPFVWGKKKHQKLETGRNKNGEFHVGQYLQISFFWGAFVRTCFIFRKCVFTNQIHSTFHGFTLQYTILQYSRVQYTTLLNSYHITLHYPIYIHIVYIYIYISYTWCHHRKHIFKD